MIRCRAASRALLLALAAACSTACAARQTSPDQPAPPAAPASGAASPAPASDPASSPADSILLTIFLRHDQSKTLDQINAHLDSTGYRLSFPPPGAEVVSWYVMMGIGQVVTLRVPASQLRAVNVAIERGAWGAFRTEFYPTYDYVPIWKEARQKALQKAEQPAAAPTPKP